MARRNQRLKIIIYNGKIYQTKIKLFGKNLNNVGRESHTWLYHIVENYKDLDDVNIFMQGRIDDLGCMAFKDPHDYLKVINKTGFAASRYGLLGPLHWGWHVGLEKNKKYKKQWDSGKISRSKIGFRNFAKELFQKYPYLCLLLMEDVLL